MFRHHINKVIVFERRYLNNVYILFMFFYQCMYTLCLILWTIFLMQCTEQWFHEMGDVEYV